MAKGNRRPTGARPRRARERRTGWGPIAFAALCAMGAGVVVLQNGCGGATPRRRPVKRSPPGAENGTPPSRDDASVAGDPAAGDTERAAVVTKAPAPPRADFYVATDGDDGWSGTTASANDARTDGPFATLERARDALRSLRASAATPRRELTALVRGGTYRRERTFLVGREDSGTPESSTVFRAYPGEEVRLSGGPRVPAEAFTPVTNASVLERLDAGARGRVLQADLRALGITDLGSFPTKYRGAPAVPEVFFDDRRLTLARWPDTEWTTIARIVDAGSNPRVGDEGKKGGVFEYAGDRPARWNVDAGVWLLGYWCFDWYEESIRVKSIDTAQRRIAMAVPALYSIKQGNPSPRRYCAVNVFEELTVPGEYYIDRDAARLYLIPPGPMDGARIVLSTLREPVVTIRDAADVVLRGFVIETSQANGVLVSGGRNVRVQACVVRNVRQGGVSVSGGEKHRVEACDIHDTGTGGIALRGGDRKNLVPAGHEALNNHVWGFSRHQKTYASAIKLNGVGNRAAHNVLHDAPHQAVGIGGNDHVFEFNVVHHVNMETDDSGAYYKGRNPSCRGNVIRHNFWHNIGSPMGHGNAAIYFDDGDGGDTVIGNVFFRCGDPGKGSFATVFSHGGHDLLTENNIFIECKRALGSAPWNDSRWKKMIDGGLWQTRLLEEVDIRKPPYTTRYPRLVGFMQPKRGVPRTSSAVCNLFVMCADIKSGNWEVDEDDNWTTSEDPGFVDAANGDFRLKPDAEAFRRLPGFKAIPFDKIGLYEDDLRPVLPERSWPYPPPTQLPPLAAKRGAPPPKPRTGPPPVFEVRRAARSVKIDGVVDAAEWVGAGKVMKLAQDHNGNRATRTSTARLMYEANALVIAVDNTVHPDTKHDGNAWGRNDAVEVSLRVVRSGKPGDITVIRGYGNGFLRVGRTPNGRDDPASMEPGPIRYKARVVDRGRWTAEFRIPFRMFDCDPAVARRIAFSLTVRKARDDLWLMWEGTRAHSYDVTRAGFIQLVP